MLGLVYKNCADRKQHRLLSCAVIANETSNDKKILAAGVVLILTDVMVQGDVIIF